MPKNKKMGRCRLCGKYGELSYEHLPPKAAFNNKPTKMYNGIDILTNNKKTGNGFADICYENQQKGAGGYTLCSTCNNITGAKYNIEYQKFVNALGNIILSTDNDLPYNISFTSNPLDCLAIFKQIMSMFCSISDTCSFDTNLCDFILDENSTSFNSSKYQLYIYGVHKASKIGRICGDTILLKQNGDKIKLSEISYFPIGLILDMTNCQHSYNIKGCDITDLSKFRYGEKNQIEMSMPIHIVNSEIISSFATLENL
ncbi:hypothetical protein [Hungatella hathewayi]|uniref:hypothetical protein n=1 Tax=Hungatella hathewayi TaxID=154046 RepID=UPI00356892BD